MIAQYTQAAIVSELKRLADPASVDSIPSSAMQEDHVSMGWSSARKLRRAVDGLTRVLAIEVLTAARGLDLRAPLEPSPAHRRGDRDAAATTRCRRPRPRPATSSPEIEATVDLVAPVHCVAPLTPPSSPCRSRDRRSRMSTRPEPATSAPRAAPS